MKRHLTGLLAIATVAVGTVVGVTSVTAASAAAPVHRGRISILVVAHGSGKSYDVVTGAIADYGTDHDAGHNAQEIVLSKGSFQLSAGRFNKNFTSKVDKATCAVVASSHAQRSATGACELNKPPTSASDVITGTGTVSYGPGS